MKNPYALLGVAPDASMKEIKKAYIRCIKFIHPDQFEMYSLEWENANKQLSEINEAYRALKERHAVKAAPTREAPTPKSPPGRARRTGPPPHGDARQAGRGYRPGGPAGGAGFEQGRAAPGNGFPRAEAEMQFVEELGEIVKGAAAFPALFRAAFRWGNFLAATSVVVCFLATLAASMYFTATPLSQAASRFAFANNAYAPVPMERSRWAQESEFVQNGCEFEIQAAARNVHTRGFYCVRFRGPSEASPTVQVFIPGGGKSIVKLPAGKFEMVYAYGESWYGDKLHFGPETVYLRMETVFDIERREPGQQLRKCLVQIHPHYRMDGMLSYPDSERASVAIPCTRISPATFEERWSK